MKSLVQKISIILCAMSKQLNRFSWFAAGIFLGAMLLTVGLQVVARYVFFSPPSWTEELARYFMIWAGLLGATVSFYRREDPVLMRLPQLKSPALARLAMMLRAAAVIIFLVPVVYYSPPILMHHMDRLTESTQITSAYIFVIVPIFASIILFHLLARIMAHLAAGFSCNR